MAGDYPADTTLVCAAQHRAAFTDAITLRGAEGQGERAPSRRYGGSAESGPTACSACRTGDLCRLCRREAPGSAPLRGPRPRS